MLRFFIDRPIFASVISVMIVLAGLAALRQLALEQYPNVVPPQVVVTASYPGASAAVVADSVASPLEQEINGVEDMIYMDSTSTDTGTLKLTVTFDIGTDPDQATINVNNRVQAAAPRLPQVVRDMGLGVQARSTDILLLGVLTSPDDSMGMVEISNYALLNMLDELVRIEGVGDASLFGLQDYAMRIWLDPARLAKYELTTQDVAAALREQNAEYATGRLGSPPDSEEEPFTFTVTSEGQLTTPAQFESIVLRGLADGSNLRLGMSPGWNWAPRITVFPAPSMAHPQCPSRSIWSPEPMHWTPPTGFGTRCRSSGKTFRPVSNIPLPTTPPNLCERPFARW